MSTRIPFLEELREELLEHAPPVRRPAKAMFGSRPRHGPAWAAAALATMVAVIGLTLMWSASRDDEPIAGGGGGWHFRVAVSFEGDPTRLLSDLRSVPGVVGVSPSVDEVGEGFHVTVDRLDRPEEVAIRASQLPDAGGIEYSDRVTAALAEEFFARAEQGAIVLRSEPMVLQPAHGPELRFDTSDLGIHIPLEPARPGEVDDLASRFPGSGLPTGAPSTPIDVLSEPHPSRPILHLGRGVGPNAQWSLVLYPTTGDGYWASMVDESGSGATGHLFKYTRYGGVGSTGGSSGSQTVVPVPTSTAVVVFTRRNREPMWQQPVLGWAMFPGSGDGAATIEAFDADGNLIGRWKTP